MITNFRIDKIRQSIPQVEGHCKDCDNYNKEKTFCEKYKMISKPYQWCKSCTGAKDENV